MTYVTTLENKNILRENTFKGMILVRDLSFAQLVFVLIEWVSIEPFNRYCSHLILDTCYMIHIHMTYHT